MGWRIVGLVWTPVELHINIHKTRINARKLYKLLNVLVIIFL